MAKWYVHPTQVNDLPPACTMCGESPVSSVRHKFVVYPEWVKGLVHFHFVGLIFAAGNEQELKMDLPVCRKHKRYLEWPAKAVFIMVVFALLGLWTVGIALVMHFDPFFKDGLFEWLLLGIGLLALPCLIYCIIYAIGGRELKIVNMTPERIEFDGVDEKFLEAFEVWQTIREKTTSGSETESAECGEWKDGENRSE